MVRSNTQKRNKLSAGIDEAGRGPLAGPVVAAAVVIKGKFNISSIKDSKELSAKKREELFKILVKHPSIEWGIDKVSEKTIDRINILEATKLAMQKAVQNLEKKFRSVDFLVIDGNFQIPSRTPQVSIVKGDKLIPSCSAASILAKVTRDRLMLRYHKIYPQYGFDKHKGYGTASHIKAIKKYGPCKIHRMTFRPLANKKK